MLDDLPRVLLDSNVFRDGGYGRSTWFRHLLTASADGRVAVLVPEAVILEVARLHSREVAALKEVDDIRRLAAAAGLDISSIDRQLITSAFELELRRLLTEADVEVVAAPPIPHEEIVRRIVGHRRPTRPPPAPSRDKDVKRAHDDARFEGYRDHVIWACVAEQAQQGALSFISSNTRDFAAAGDRQGGRAPLHEHLVADLESQGTAPDVVTLVCNLETFVREHLARDVDLGRIERLLAHTAGRRLTDEIVHVPIKLWVDVEDYEPPVVIDAELDAVTLTRVTALNELRLVDAFETSQDEGAAVWLVVVEVSAIGWVEWLATGPGAGSERMSLLRDEEHDVSLELRVSGLLNVETLEWDDVDIQYAIVTPPPGTR